MQLSVNKNITHFLELNLGLIMVATSGPLGRYITMTSSLATFWRAFFGLISIVLIARFLKASFAIDWQKHAVILIGTSVLLVGHWMTYFYSLDYSNVAIALMTLYTFPAMTAILEPLFERRRIPILDVGLALVTLMALYIIVPPLGVDGRIGLAITLGLASALCFSLRNIWISQISSVYSGTSIMVYQLLFSTIFLAPLLFTASSTTSGSQWTALIALGLVTTAGGHTLFLRGIARYRATLASLFMCLTPIYGICLAYIFLGEIPSPRTAIGGLIILGVVLFKARKV